MATWKNDDDHTGETFDDGLTFKPGEEGFTRELAEKHFGHKNVSYMGTPNWAPPAPPAVGDDIDPAPQAPAA